MPVHALSETDILAIINDSEVDEKQLAESLEPRHCRHCGLLLVPEVRAARILYVCADCDDPTSSRSQ